MAPSIAASILLSNGYDPILQLGCRNRNRIALLGELLGARAIGIDSLMLVRGDVLPEGYKPRPKAVMDTDAKDLIATASLMNQDAELGVGKEFLIGTSATVHDPTPERHPEELLAKADAGAQFVITQICFDTQILGRYLDFLIARQLLWRISVIVSVGVILSAELAVALRDSRRALIPAAAIECLTTTADPAAVGADLCVGVLRSMVETPGIAGVHFAAVGGFELIPGILAEAGIT
jgi:methylenetetrahydrofolate reductase (NADPH)